MLNQIKNLFSVNRHEFPKNLLKKQLENIYEILH